MWSVHKMMAFYWDKLKNGSGLSKEEIREFHLCLDANMNKVRKLAELENLSYVASTINDVEWQHEICEEIEKTIPHYISL